MEITNQQIQVIQDAYEMANKISKNMEGNKNPLTMTLAEQARWNYWEGKRRALRDVIDLLEL